MKPYYDRDGITLYQGDCREVLPRLDRSVADMALVDPPYGETRLSWDRRVEGWLPLVADALTPNGTLWLFGSFRAFLALSTQLSDWQHCQEVVWEKQNGSNSHADRFRRVHELLVQFIRRGGSWSEAYHQPQFTNDAVAKRIRRRQKPVHWSQIEPSVYRSVDGGSRLMRSVLSVASCHGYAEHPTQKPIELLLPIVSYSCPPDGLLLDPMMGVGSSLVAAKRLGRRAIGIEIDESYCEKAAERLAQAVLPLEIPA